MAKKEFSYRGKSLEELQDLSESDFIQMLPSRQRRSILRGKTVAQQKFVDKFLKKGDRVKTHCRDMIVMPNMVGKTIQIHNGKGFEAVMIQPEMIGMFFGELALTRKLTKHSSPGVGATKSSSSVSVR